MTVEEYRLFLDRKGLVECPECRSWVRISHDAFAFHYRRCTG